MRTLDLDRLAACLSEREDIAFAVVFGSAKDGTVGPESDLDLGVCFRSQPDTEELLEFMAEVAAVLQFDSIDVVDLAKADPILGFEAISGRFLCRNDRARTAELCSLISRVYEDAIAQLHRVA